LVLQEKPNCNWPQNICLVSYNFDFSCKTIFESLLDRFAGPENIYTKMFPNISFENIGYGENNFKISFMELCGWFGKSMFSK